MVIRKFVVFDSSFVEHNCLKLYYGDFYAVILCCWKSSPLFPKVVAFFCENTWKCWWHHKKTSRNLFNPPKITGYINFMVSYLLFKCEVIWTIFDLVMGSFVFLCAFVERNNSRHPIFGVFGEKDGVPNQGTKWAATQTHFEH